MQKVSDLVPQLRWLEKTPDQDHGQQQHVKGKPWEGKDAPYTASKSKPGTQAKSLRRNCLERLQKSDQDLWTPCPWTSKH